MKLFPKLALMVSALVLGSILYLSLSYYLGEERQIKQDAQAEQRQALQNLAHIARESFLTDDDLLLLKYIRLQLQLNPEMVTASVVDQNGKIRSHSEPSRIGQKEGENTQSASVLMLNQSIKLGPNILGTASVGFSQSKLDEKLKFRLAALRKRLATVTCLGFLLSLAGCFGMALSWTNPIKRLAQGAQDIGDGKRKIDLSQVEERPDELGSLAQAFQGMAVRLGELDQMKEDFVSAVTHELQSPLSAIESFLNLIDHEEKNGIPPDVLRDYHQRIRLNNQRLSRFVNDLLDVSALERGKVILQQRAFSVPKAAKEILRLFEARLCEKKLAVNVECKANIPQAWADQAKVEQVLINLIGNAMKFTPESGHIEISIEDLAPKKYLRVCVTDTGMGISEKDQLRIFNKFEQAQTARQQVKGAKGTGLGLAICRELIQLHGGEIGVTSRLGQGSTFYFTLPAAGVPPELAKPLAKEDVPWAAQPLST